MNARQPRQDNAQFQAPATETTQSAKPAPATLTSAAGPADPRST